MVPLWICSIQRGLSKALKRYMHFLFISKTSEPRVAPPGPFEVKRWLLTNSMALNEEMEQLLVPANANSLATVIAHHRPAVVG